MIVLYRLLFRLWILTILYPQGISAKKSKEQLQNILMHTFGDSDDNKSEPTPLVLPWKRPSTVIEYTDILTFTDEAEITDNHICQCRLEEYKNDSLGGTFEGAL